MFVFIYKYIYVCIYMYILIFPILQFSLCTSIPFLFSLSLVHGSSPHLQSQTSLLMPPKGHWSSNYFPSPLSVTSPLLVDPSCQWSSSLSHSRFLKKEPNPQHTPYYTLVSKPWLKKKREYDKY